MNNIIIFFMIMFLILFTNANSSKTNMKSETSQPCTTCHPAAAIVNAGCSKGTSCKYTNLGMGSYWCCV